MSFLTVWNQTNDNEAVCNVAASRSSIDPSSSSPPSDERKPAAGKNNRRDNPAYDNNYGEASSPLSPSTMQQTRQEDKSRSVCTPIVERWHSTDCGGAAAVEDKNGGNNVVVSSSAASGGCASTEATQYSRVVDASLASTSSSTIATRRRSRRSSSIKSTYRSPCGGGDADMNVPTTTATMTRPLQDHPAGAFAPLSLQQSTPLEYRTSSNKKKGGDGKSKRKRLRSPKVEGPSSSVVTPTPSQRAKMRHADPSFASPSSASNIIADKGCGAVSIRSSKDPPSGKENDALSSNKKPLKKRGARARQRGNPAKKGTGPAVLQDQNNDGGSGKRIQRRKPSNQETPFPELVFAMVTDTAKARPSIIDWIEDGDAFVVKEKGAKLGSILQKHFNHAKYSSLQRQLNMYGFRKHTAGKYKGAFRHPHFHRESSAEELAMIIRRPPPTRKRNCSAKDKDKTDAAVSGTNNRKRKAFKAACEVIADAVSSSKDVNINDEPLACSSSPVPKKKRTRTERDSPREVQQRQNGAACMAVVDPSSNDNEIDAEPSNSSSSPVPERERTRQESSSSYEMQQQQDAKEAIVIDISGSNITAVPSNSLQAGASPASASPTNDHKSASLSTPSNLPSLPLPLITHWSPLILNYFDDASAPETAVEGTPGKSAAPDSCTLGEAGSTFAKSPKGKVVFLPENNEGSGPVTTSLAGVHGDAVSSNDKKSGNAFGLEFVLHSADMSKTRLDATPTKSSYPSIAFCGSPGTFAVSPLPEFGSCDRSFSACTPQSIKAFALHRFGDAGGLRLSSPKHPALSLQSNGISRSYYPTHVTSASVSPATEALYCDEELSTSTVEPEQVDSLVQLRYC